jgi:hypothetical protein
MKKQRKIFKKFVKIVYNERGFEYILQIDRLWGASIMGKSFVQKVSFHSNKVDVLLLRFRKNYP